MGTMDKSFEVYQGKTMSPWVQKMTRRRIDWLCAQAVGRVLDVGCSQAIVPWLLARKKLDVTGIDADAEALAWAGKNLEQCEPALRQRITLIHGDFGAFNPGQSFDTIVAGEYLEHLTDAELAAHLAHMRGLLAPGGRVAITTPLGLHPHPDHRQTFFPRNLADALTPHFSIALMEVEDGYLRCLCDLSVPARRPSSERLLELCERGLRQIQERALAGKTPRKPVDTIEKYLADNASHPSGPLADCLAAQGLRAPFMYDINLFRALNRLYANKPIAPAPRRIAPDSLFAQADIRVDALLKMLPSFKALKCLEVGCGRGETAVRLAERGGCSVTGVDITRYAEWEERWSPRTRFLPLDITYEAPFPSNTFDFIFSFVVLEHVASPLDMLTSIHRLLKPGGLLYFTANLYRGPMASHRYREVFFPWPHLIFDDAVFTRFYREEGYTSNGAPAWVNKLTHLHYLEHIRKLNFEILHCTYTRRPLDRDFYMCFNEKLGKYPKEDLELDFIKLHVRKKQEK